MRTKQDRPWLTSTGVEIPTRELKEICKSWEPGTWAAYLKWYAAGLGARLVKPAIYDSICEGLTKSVFDQFGPSRASDEQQQLCEQFLETIPTEEAAVLTQTFFEGKTLRQIAAVQKISKSSVHDLKNRALLRLRRGHQGKQTDTREFMRGESSEGQNLKTSPWMQSPSFLIREARMYDPKNHKAEFENIQNSALRLAIRELSENQQRIIYLRFWCDYSINDIARELCSGVNIIDQVCDATISKLKRKIIQIEFNPSLEGGPSCA